MYLAKIKKNNVVTNVCQFETLEQAQSWVDQESQKGVFGKLAWTEDVRAVFDEFGNEVEPAYQIQHAQEFEVEYQDITATAVLSQNISKNLERMEFGKSIMAELAAMNQQGLSAGQISVEQILIAEEKLSKVQRLLLNGSTGLALQTLSTLDIPELSDTIKLYFVQKIQSYLAAGG